MVLEFGSVSMLLTIPFFTGLSALVLQRFFFFFTEAHQGFHYVRKQSNSLASPISLIDEMATEGVRPQCLGHKISLFYV